MLESKTEAGRELKVSPPLADMGAERFLREIKMAANLTHAHILPVFDSGEADGLLFYVMPNMEGHSLRHRLEKERQLPLDDAIRIAAEVASALDYSHRQQVMHRDIKPENILLHEGSALVADFGIGKALSGGKSITQTGLAVGTPAYMSPEQASGDATVDGRSDLYSLGCVLYEMLSGEPPFHRPECAVDHCEAVRVASSQRPNYARCARRARDYRRSRAGTDAS